MESGDVPAIESGEWIHPGQTCNVGPVSGAIKLILFLSAKVFTIESISVLTFNEDYSSHTARLLQLFRFTGPG